MSCLYFHIILVCGISFALTQRVSSKLDFGGSEGIVNPGFRPAREPYEFKLHQDRTNLGSQPLETVGVVCVSDGCNTTKGETGNVSTDVLVHIKTNVNLDKTKNESPENILDVPVVLGTNDPDHLTNRQFIGPNPSYRNFGFAEDPPLVTRNNVFIPSTPVYSALIPRRRYEDPNLYNDVRFQENGFPPSPMWYPRGGNVQNPVEFRKVYNTVPGPVRWGSTRPTFGGEEVNRNYYSREQAPPSAWTPCICPSSSPTPYALPDNWHNQSPGPHVNGKLADIN